MTVRHFCTYLDRRYLTRGLALIESLHRHCPRFRIWVLCMDDASHKALTALDVPEIALISLDEFERDDLRLRAAKSNRSLIEYYFTCTPSLPLFVLRRQPQIDMLTYLDADLFFFASPEPLFDEIGLASIAIVPHRFPDTMRKWAQCGVYNVGWLTFRRDADALECLTWWRERCIEWCYDRVELGRFADQKYLDDWPARFRGVRVITHNGANVASWNLERHRINRSGDELRVDGQALIFFHFHHLKRRASWLFETDFHLHSARANRLLKSALFTPYLRTLDAQATRIAVHDESPPIRESLQISEPLHTRQVLRDVVAGRSLVYINGRVW